MNPIQLLNQATAVQARTVVGPCNDLCANILDSHLQQVKGIHEVTEAHR